MIHKREGFTWVELVLVVMAMIIIAAIVFPLFAPHCGRSHQTRCLNNLKQIATAIEMYEDDYEGGILPWSIGDTDLRRGNYRTWVDLLQPYLEQMKRKQQFSGAAARSVESIYVCPGMPHEIAGLPWGFTLRGYGYNPYLTKSISAKKVPYPTLTLRMTETALYEYDVHNLPPNISDAKYKGASFSAPMPKGRFKERMKNPQAPGWHNGYNDVLWVDGHVSSITWQRVMFTDHWDGTTDPNVCCRLSPKWGYTVEH